MEKAPHPKAATLERKRRWLRESSFYTQDEVRFVDAAEAARVGVPVAQVEADVVGEQVADAEVPGGVVERTPDLPPAERATHRERRPGDRHRGIHLEIMRRPGLAEEVVGIEV